MATKNHVDSSVAERRLRPIYSWLDDGNNKKALQEAEKVLKKQPNFQCAKVLKALALLRLGKENECKLLLESVRKELHCDDSTLQAMTICYREMNQPETICEIYSEAAKKDPKNEELLTHLFMAFVRNCDYKKQQQTAMTLYKLKFKNHYYFWSVMSIVMQAHEAGPEVAKRLQLPLAEKMVKKFVDDGKIEAEQEVQLYIMILEMQNKLEEALKVVEGPLGEMLHSYIVVPTKRIELLMKMECWKRANVEIKKILVEDMDNWSLYLNYFQTVFHIVDLNSSENGTVEDDSADKTVNDCVRFITDLKEKDQSASHHLRGPYLATLEFFVQLRKNGIDPKVHFGNFTDLLSSYFYYFGTKPCCLNDLRPYLNVLDETEIKCFLDEIWKFIELEDGQLPNSKEQMLKYMSNLHITRYLGFHEKLNVEAKMQLTDCLFRYYVHGAQYNASNLLPTDIRHNDPFIILIVEMLNDMWLETNDSVFLKHAIVILEHALAKSPSNHQFKVLLIKLYNILGISKAAHLIYELLDVKHVQLDSMGYLMCTPLIATGQYFLASHLIELTLKFFTSNYKDSADHLTFLYKFGSFLKIHELIQFRERLNNSLHYSALTVEKMLLEIFHSVSYQNTAQLIDQMSIHPERESINFTKLEDNRDLDLIWTSDPPSKQLSNEMVKISYEHEVEFLQIRSLLLRILGGVVQLGSTKIGSLENGNNEDTNAQKNEEENLKTLEDLYQQLKILSTSLAEKNFTRLPRNAIHSPMESRLFYLLELPYLELLQTLLLTVLTMKSDDLSKNESSPVSENNPVARLSEAISVLSTQCKSLDPSQLELRCRILNLLTLIIEMVSVTCLFCGAALDIAKPCTNFQTKKGKKKKDTSSVHSKSEIGTYTSATVCVRTAQTLLEVSKSAVEELKCCINFIEENWKKPMSNDSLLSNLMRTLSLESTGTNFSELFNFQEVVFESYQSSLIGITNILRVKSKFLSDLQL